MKKHYRQIINGVRELGFEVEFDHNGTGHAKLTVTLPDGRVGRFPVACTPRNNKQALKNAIRQIKSWERSGLPHVRSNTR